MKRKIVGLGLALTMVLSVTACSNGNNAGNNNAANNNANHNHVEENNHDHNNNHNHNNMAEGHEDDHDHGGFEWMGEYDLKAGTYTMKFETEEDHEHLAIGMKEVNDKVEDLEHDVLHIMEIEKPDFELKNGEEVTAKSDHLMDIELVQGINEIKLVVAEDGRWAFGFEHEPKEFNFQLLLDGEEVAPAAEHEGAVHEH